MSGTSIIAQIFVPQHKLNNNITKPPPYYFSGSIPCLHTIELLTEVSSFPEKYH